MHRKKFLSMYNDNVAHEREREREGGGEKGQKNTFEFVFNPMKTL